MEVSCQFAVYPLGVSSLEPWVSAALEAVRRAGLEPRPGAMSTLVVGPAEAVFRALAGAFDAVAAAGCVMTATVSNACPVVSEEGRSG